MRASRHAVRRFRERTGCQKDEGYVLQKLLDMAERGKLARLKNRKFRTLALLNHGLREARYVMHGTFVLVIEDDVITTVHNNEAKRWEVDR